jgi:arylsulfatase G
MECTACPHDYVSSPTKDRPRRCVLKDTNFDLDGVHCGEDTGLGSIWEANLRMPALARWPGMIPRNSESTALVSTLDVVPTVLSILGKDTSKLQLDGLDVSTVLLYGNDTDFKNRTLFFWRDGFAKGPLPPPYGRYDVVAIKVGRLKAWFWTKSAHYNPDPEVFHDPPLLFDTLADPAEAHPLDPNDHVDFIAKVKAKVQKHKDSVDWTYPLTLKRDPQYIPCVDRETGCRTDSSTRTTLDA